MNAKTKNAIEKKKEKEGTKKKAALFGSTLKDCSKDTPTLIETVNNSSLVARRAHRLIVD